MAAGRSRLDSRLIGLLPLPFLTACIAIPVPNPDYPSSDVDVRSDIRRMKAEPKKLDRPVLVLGGYRAPDWSAWGLGEQLRRLTGAEKGGFATLGYPFRSDFDAISDSAVQLVEERWPSSDPVWTSEVDVVGISMGGLVGRTAAAPPSPDRPTRKRLRIHRLFTMGTPHRGAKLAEYIAPDPAARSMKPGSPFLARLDEQLSGADYEMICYARLNDTWVGASRSAPPGMEPIWTGGTLFLSHITITQDDRIVADISRRLRGESPLALKGSKPPRD